jgi:hypothetical protein
MSLAKVAKKGSYLEAVEADLMDQPAVQAWLQTDPNYVAPKRIEHLRRLSSRAYVGRMLGVGKNGSSVIAKRCDMASGLTERMFYEDVLPQLSMSKLEYYGSFVENGEHLWLFLEDAGGRKFSFSNPGDRQAAVLWLASFHTSGARLIKPDMLIERHPAYYLNRLTSAKRVQASHINNPILSATDRQTLANGLDQMAATINSWDKIEALYDRLPHSVIHGDFKTKNINLRVDNNRTSIFPFDWENGGWGIPGVDMWKLDEAEYLQAVNGHWPQADIHTIREIKYLGTIFRAIDGFFWEVKSLDYADEPNVRVRVIDRLFRYRFHMAGAMQALNI